MGLGQAVVHDVQLNDATVRAYVPTGQVEHTVVGGKAYVPAELVVE